MLKKVTGQEFWTINTESSLLLVISDAYYCPFAGFVQI